MSPGNWMPSVNELFSLAVVCDEMHDVIGIGSRLGSNPDKGTGVIPLGKVLTRVFPIHPRDFT